MRILKQLRNAALAGVAGLGLTVALAGAAAAQAPIVIKFSHVVTDNAPKGKTALKFKELAGKTTAAKGRTQGLSQASL